MARRFDFVSVPQPMKPGFGLTSSDRQKVRSRAAKNDPFSEEVKRRSKKSKVKKVTGDVPRSSSHVPPARRPIAPPADATFASDILQLQTSAYHLSLSAPVTPELETPEFQGNDEGYFSHSSADSNSVSPEETTSVALLADAVFEAGEVDVIELEESTRIVEECNDQLLNLVSTVQPYLSAARIDPFWTFPVRFRKCLPAVLHHEVHFLAPVVPGLDSGRQERNLLRWFALGIHEPAHLFATLAFATAHLIDAGSNLASLEDVYFLRGSAIAAVNEALKDPERATSTAMIGAVMCLAAFEFAFGDTDTYRTHMDGTKQMIAMRGGIDTLEPWVARFLKWVAGSTAVWKVFWPYSRHMHLTDALDNYNRAESVRNTVQSE